MLIIYDNTPIYKKAHIMGTFPPHNRHSYNKTTLAAVCRPEMEKK